MNKNNKTEMSVDIIAIVMGIIVFFISQNYLMLLMGIGLIVVGLWSLKNDCENRNI